MRQEERCSLDKNTSIEKQGQRLDTRVHCSWTCLGKSEERGHDRDRRRKTVRNGKSDKERERRKDMRKKDRQRETVRMKTNGETEGQKKRRRE